jgi:hypothetical protein
VDDDTIVLEEFVVSLPGGWQYEFDHEVCSRLSIWRSGFAAGTTPIVVLYRTSDKYLVAVSDHVVPASDVDLGGTEQEVFNCETKNEPASRESPTGNGGG